MILLYISTTAPQLILKIGQCLLHVPLKFVPLLIPTLQLPYLLPGRI
jgi:hypothetical protein